MTPEMLEYRITRLQERIAVLEQDAQATETERLRAMFCGLLAELGVVIQAAAPVKYTGFGADGRPLPTPDNSDAARLERVLSRLQAVYQRYMTEAA